VTYSPFVRTILIDEEPNRCLHQKSLPVTKKDLNDPLFRQTLQDMALTLFTVNGIGLSAVQIGLRKRACVIARDMENKSAIALLNPKIISGKDQEWMDEGCLSKPNFRCDVLRYKSITVRALDPNGHKTTFTATGIIAQCIQHELDHFRGRLISDQSLDAPSRNPAVVDDAGRAKIFLPA
jgi:peptide deformylase